MSQQFKALAVLIEDMSLVPSIHEEWLLATSVTPRNVTPSSGLCGQMLTHGHTESLIHIYT